MKQENHYCVYRAPWSQFAQAFYVRYPSPYSNHVITVDTLERTIDPHTFNLFTTRLLLKRGSLPRWFPSGFVTKAESWILEDSLVDPNGKILLCRTRNLDHRRILDAVEQTATIPIFDGQYAGQTLAYTSAELRSSFGPEGRGAAILRRQIENFGINAFKRNAEKSRSGLELVIRALQSPLGQRILSGMPVNWPPLHLAFDHWEETGSGFSGHGLTRLREPERTPIAEVDPNPHSPVKRPFRWWRLHWRYREEIEGIQRPPKRSLRAYLPWRTSRVEPTSPDSPTDDQKTSRPNLVGRSGGSDT